MSSPADIALPSLDIVHEIHARVLELGGGADGVRDEGLLLSAIASARSGYHQTLAQIVAAYVHGVAKNHGYIDANKRAALGVLITVLGANGFPVELSDAWIDIMEQLADGRVSRDDLCAHIVTLMGGMDVEIAG